MTVAVSLAPFYDLTDKPGADEATPNDDNPNPKVVPRFSASKTELALFPGGSASTIQWLKFQTGDPGVPGDGKTAPPGTWLDPAAPIFYVAQPPVPLAGMTDGFTVTVFPSAGTTIMDGGVAIEALNPPPGCPVTGPGFSLINRGGIVTVSGVQGIVANIPQQEILATLEILSGQIPGCNYTIANMSLIWVWATTDFAGNNPIPVVDAVAFGPGQNNVPK